MTRDSSETLAQSPRTPAHGKEASDAHADRRSPSTGGFQAFKNRMRAMSPAAHGQSSGGFHMDERRGRDPLISTGRGGAGNHVRSISRGPDEAGGERGRELREKHVEGPTHAGRGGAGNIRSPSRDPQRNAIEQAQEDALQDKLLAERRGRQVDAPFSSGRGGAGNITSDSRSRSRSAVRELASPSAANSRLDRNGSTSRTRAPAAGGAAARDESQSRRPFQSVHAGRGGYGNITEEATEEDLARRRQEELYETAVKKKYDTETGGQSKTTGRGGAGSLGQTPVPVDLSTLSLEERQAHAKVHAHDKALPTRGGRGGAGNIVSPEQRGREASNGTHSGGVIGSMLRSLSRATRGEAK